MCLLKCFSDSSLTNAVSRQKPGIYQDPVMQMQSGATGVPVIPVDAKINLSDPNASKLVNVQQVQDSASGYVLQQAQLEQHQQLLHHLQQQQQQFIQPGAHYIQQHQVGAVPISHYYTVYPSQQQQQHQQYPVYYVPAKQPQAAYNMSVQQPNAISEAPTSVPSSRPPPSAYNPMINAHMGKPEMVAAGVYRTATTGTPQLVQVPAIQQQQPYVGYAQIHHPSQSVTAPTSAVATANYGYEFADPSHAQMYYTQPMAPTMTSQYQTMAGTAVVVLPNASAQLSAENIKQHQIRTSQPL